MTDLTNGAIVSIHNGKTEDLTAILQVLDVKKCEGKIGLVISDGQAMMPGFFGPKVNVEDLGVTEKCVIEVKSCLSKMVGSKIVAILNDVEVLSNEETKKIGNPKKVSDVLSETSSGQFTTPSPHVKKTTSRVDDKKSSKGVQRNLYCQPIATLNPYGSDGWTIKAKVTMKGKMNSWMKNGRSGRLFNVHLLDAHGGEIRATFYNEAADTFFPKLEKGKIYTFSKGRLKLAKRMYSTLNNTYEVIFNEHSVIAEAQEDEHEKIGEVKHKYKPIAEISDCPVKSLVNVIGVVQSFTKLRSITSKAGKEIHVRKINLADDSKAAIDIACWGEKENLTDEILAEKPILAIIGCRVSDWDTRSLSTVSTAEVLVNPKNEHAKRIREWNENGDQGEIKTLSVKTQQSGSSGPLERVDICEMERVGLNSLDGSIIETRGSIAYIYHSKERLPYYNACPKCNKKVTGSEGAWTCDSCGKDYQKAEKRYLLRVSLCDHTGHQYVNCFNDQGRKILNKTAKEVGEFLETDEKAFEKVFKDSYFKEYRFICKAQRDEYQGQTRARCILLKAAEVDVEAECEYLFKQIEKYEKNN